MYKHIYFDLDRTIWDFEENAKETFGEIFIKHSLEKIFGDFSTFLTTYHKHNNRLWNVYKQGKIKKDTLMSKRFYLTLKEYGIKDEGLSKQISNDYVNIIPTKTRLFPGSREILNYLIQKYSLYVITNGFEELQYGKIKNCGLTSYFKKIITAEAAGYQKPRVEIFEYALKVANAKKVESLMIGDDLEIDIKGAKNIGMDHIYFNPTNRPHNEKVTYEINQWPQLKGIL